MSLVPTPSRDPADLGTALTNSRSPISNELSAVNLEKIKDHLITQATAINSLAPNTLALFGFFETTAGDTGGQVVGGGVLDIPPDQGGYTLPTGLTLLSLWLNVPINDAVTSTTIAVYKNGIVTALTITLTAATTGVSHVTATVDFAPGDTFSLLALNTAGGVGHSVAFFATMSTRG